MAIYPLFKISPYDTLFLLPQFNLFLIQGIAGSVPAIPNMKLVMEKNSGEKKTRRPNSERVGAWAIIQHAKLGRLESENSESKNLS